ncbi:AtuA-related protein [Bordetella genomosp. 12]|uniref:AtuA-like ferredoxin-fold domain-containing protein n=1 Tax=Bordetella genomosp. 12 TaxID=463035 RepID=A0A261VBN3_9BORD|nr:hypothetical protein [Bordetella genomosp. 12]OZI70952.1 hypothetical protein CAL22_13720 [Bordetella genomosp. 12]
MGTLLHTIAHSRAGDKGNIANISVIAYDAQGWERIRRQLSSELVASAFQHIASGPVERHELPQLRALNFVIHNALGGGVTVSTAQDPHGKSLSYLMLNIVLPD